MTVVVTTLRHLLLSPDVPEPRLFGGRFATSPEVTLMCGKTGRAMVPSTSESLVSFFASTNLFESALRRRFLRVVEPTGFGCCRPVSPVDGRVTEFASGAGFDMSGSGSPDLPL